jgi:hypothetical protein
MADAVTVNVVSESPDEYCVHLTNISDGTGESAVIKVDKSAIAVATDGLEPDSLDILEARWNIQGFVSVRILWDHTTDDTALVLNGSGYDDFRGAESYSRAKKGLADPRSAGDTGDLLLTTAGAVSGATYDITLRLKKSPQ